MLLFTGINAQKLIIKVDEHVENRNFIETK